MAKRKAHLSIKTMSTRVNSVVNITYPQPKKKRASYSVTIQSSHKTKSALVANKRNQGPKKQIARQSTT